MKRAHSLMALCLVLSSFICNDATAQSKNLAAEENRLVALYSKLATFIQGDYDSVTLYSGRFEAAFIPFIKNNPATLNYSFKKFTDSNFCSIVTSADGNLRIYSWDTWTGGTMHFYKQIYQWKGREKIFSMSPHLDEGDPGGFCSKIFTVNIKNKPYYLVVSNGVFSTMDAAQSVTVYSIDYNKLNDTARLFKTRTKKLNRIDVEFDFFSVVDRPERPVELITYDEKLQLLYIPVVDDKNQVTKKNILYQLKNDQFEFIGIETGKRK